MLIQRAMLLDGRAVDIRLGRRIEAIADNLEPITGEDVLDAAGGTVIPDSTTTTSTCVRRQRR